MRVSGSCFWGGGVHSHFRGACRVYEIGIELAGPFVPC